MPFITKSQVPTSISKPYTDEYISGLRRQLTDRLLTDAQRAEIKRLLAAVRSTGDKNNGK